MKIIKHSILKNTYYDSVTLMIISKEIKKNQGIKQALVGMGTDLNKELAANLNLSSAELQEITPNDFFVSVLTDENTTIEDVMKEVHEILSRKKGAKSNDYMPKTLDSAINYEPDSNLVLISLPGKYAADEAERALKKNLNVMIFSDNVTIEEEKKLKDLATSKGLLMMGPDCGTAIINNVPLAFANVVRKGHIGVLGASGTGIQEITVLIDKLGEGVSQVIGTGGRDLDKKIGGSMMLLGLDALINDPQTHVILLVSKPPHPEIAEKILIAAENANKPVVVNFIGGDKDIVEKYKAYPCLSLEDAAKKVVALIRNEEIRDFSGFNQPIEEINEIVKTEAKKFVQGQRYLRGFYTGGSLAGETMVLLGKDFGIYSNIPLSPEYKLKDARFSCKNTCIDFGDDAFTVGKPHPMIDPAARVERLLQDAQDDEVAVVLMDFVLGYGSHKDPAGEMLPAIIEAKKLMRERGKYLSIIGYVCGTDKDPQGLTESENRLKEAGVILMPSNAQAAKLTGLILNKISKGSDFND
jgi:succinyl-CoA synthetase alpha subunit